MYDVNIMPQTMEEYDQLIDFKFSKAQGLYEAECAKTRSAVEAHWDGLYPKSKEEFRAKISAELDAWRDASGKPMSGEEIGTRLDAALAEFDADWQKAKDQAIQNEVSFISSPPTRAELEATYSFMLDAIQQGDMAPDMLEPQGFSPDAFYRLADGTVYSVASGAFVAGHSGQAIDVPGGSEADLKNLLIFYKQTHPDVELGDCLLTQEEVIARKRGRIDAATSGSIMEGFDHEVNGETLHFNYDEFDQINFGDTAIACLMSKMGVEGLPDTVEWNGYRHGTGELVRVVLGIDDFFRLFAIALNHKKTCMDAGGVKKAELGAAIENPA